MKVRQEGSRFNPESISSFSHLGYKPTEGTPVINVRMPDGEFIRTDQLSRDALKAYMENGMARWHQYGDGIPVEDGIAVKYSRGEMDVDAQRIPGTCECMGRPSSWPRV